jgi:hypothetical protein
MRVSTHCLSFARVLTIGVAALSLWLCRLVSSESSSESSESRDTVHQLPQLISSLSDGKLRINSTLVVEHGLTRRSQSRSNSFACNCMFNWRLLSRDMVVEYLLAMRSNIGENIFKTLHSQQLKTAGTVRTPKMLSIVYPIPVVPHYLVPIAHASAPTLSHPKKKASL